VKAFIILRDRVTYARRCYAALSAAGLDVHVVDHASTWPGALSWLAELETPVLRRGENAYPWQLWTWGPFRDLMSRDPEPYVVTDPDVVPSDDCPADWPQRLADGLARSGCVKAGLGLRLDRLPPDAAGQEVAAYEHVFWEDPWEPGVFRANVDTTLALYKPFPVYPLFALGPSLRLGFPYVADHLAWYERGPLSPELAHYRAHGDPGHQVARSVR
jgi:hypothetical protein